MGHLGISPDRIPGVGSLRAAAEVMYADSTGLPVRVARPPLRYGTMSEKPPATGDLNSLLRRVAQHDADAFAEFYDLTSSRVFGLVARVLRDPGYSEETTQEVYLQVWRNAGNYDPAAGSALAWLLTLAHRRAVDRVRAEQAAAQREFRYGSATADRPADVVADSAILREERRQVAECLDTLTDAQRECIELAYYGGLTYAQVSERLSTNLATIKSRMRDALRGLRNCLGVT
jgi:RNA polymerase sigma-70 factor (ECF subfamily)